MASTNRLLSFLFLGAIAVAISACASPAVQECGATGVFCPAGTHCAAAQGICISDTNTCGNAHLDPGEICDDGNTQPGDGCSPDCLSNEQCGNGTLDKPIKDSAGNFVKKDPRNEDCDTPLAVDPNTGKFCSSVCKFEECGNGIIDKEIKEECDDGNTVGGDGCSADCLHVERCGNGHLDQPFKDANGNPDLGDPRNEVCDDGNNVDGDGCSSDCRSAEGCGNGKIDPGEECDDGKAPDGTSKNGDDKDCRSDCVINRCGDGRPDTNGLHHEDCDGGPLAPNRDRTAKPTETPTCNIDCTAPRCGDGKINRSLVLPGPPGVTLTEQCDNGMANSDSADCTANCQVNVCGDNLTNTIGPLHREGCDDGNRVDTDACTNACVAKTCGDSIVGPGEECDLGPLNSDSGACLSTCLLAKCGDGKVRTGVEECDMTAGCSAACKIQRCGNGIIDPGEDCDNGAGNNDNADCRSDCITNRCGDGHVNSTGTHHEDCDAGPVAAAGSTVATPTEAATCNIDCTTPVCGDRKVNRKFTPPGAVGPEQCDNGAGVNANNADCTATCQTSACGDGFQNTAGPAHAEGCDDGNRTDTDACTNACVAKTCGDGIVGPGEQCDLGPLNSDTGACLSNCLLATCGDGKVRTGVEECDGTSGCSAACKIQRCGNGIIDPGEDCDNGVGNNDAADCRSDCVTNRCGDGHVNSLGTHHEDCDAGPVAAAGSTVATPTEAATCNIDCTTPVCGDRKVNRKFTPLGAVGPEQCDNGTGVNADNADCTAGCQNNVCGDNHRNTVGPLRAEGCDDGNRVDTDACTNACVAKTCGDGIVGPGEQCDLGPLNSDTGACLSNCLLATCGDGKVRTGVEECDGTSGCSAACKIQQCGNGIIDPGEECDDAAGNNDNADCRSDCLLNRCGDGYRNTTGTHPEDCDDAPAAAHGTTAISPTETATCNLNCTTPRCGDGIVNHQFVPLTLGIPPVPGPGVEQCDDSGRLDSDGCSANCRFERCGNGVVDPTEECDGASVGGFACSTDCHLIKCGNGILDPGEECDDKNAINTDGCTNACRFAKCGDNIIQTGVEDCDGGNAVGGDGCSATCHTEVCGNGILDVGETCDDGNNLACGSCGLACSTVVLPAAATGLIFAGDGVVNGETLTVNDGFNAPVTFTFVDPTTVSPGPLDIRNEPSPFRAGNIANAINARVPQVVATQVPLTGIVTLKHSRLSSKANGSIATPKITDTVVTANFVVVDMSGGQAGDCVAGNGCSVNDDCASHVCKADHTCQ